jgi:hypothetical protein
MDLTLTHVAVDVFLEIFHHALFNHNRAKFESAIANPLQTILIDISVFRNFQSPLDCRMRDLIWDWLVTHDPVSFALKGRGDAELMGAFTLLCGEAKASLWSVSCNLKFVPAIGCQRVPSS